MRYSEFDRIGKLLQFHHWVGSKSFPRQYTLKKDWKNKSEFEEAVIFIRQHGAIKVSGTKWIRYMAFEGMNYWTAGSAIDQTVMINRAEPSEFDNV